MLESSCQENKIIKKLKRNLYVSIVMESFNHSIVLSWEADESVPPLTGCFHGLKSNNVFYCVSKLLFANENYTIIKKTGTLNNVEIDIILTYYISKETPHENKLVRGHLYINKKEHEVKSEYMYCSLQIGEWCYDNIQIVQLNADIFQ
jgi:hypothetical protein